MRAGLVVLLEERNYALARSIRKACAAQSETSGETSFETADDTADETTGGVGDGAVIAILGMAHLNGVRRLLGDAEPI